MIGKVTVKSGIRWAFALTFFLQIIIGNIALVCPQHIPSLELLNVKKIWDQGSHNAFTDLIRFEDSWYCVFREASQHGWAEDAVVRILRSSDNENWELVATLQSPFPELPDIRDPKITVHPGGRLMLSAAIAALDGSIYKTYVWYSANGQNWNGPTQIGEDCMWIWRLSWQADTAYGIGYPTKGGHVRDGLLRLYRSADCIRFEPHVDIVHEEGQPTESSLLFLPDRSGLCLTRNDPVGAWLGQAQPPYTAWTWTNTGMKLSGQQLIRLPDGKIIVAGRTVAEDKSQRTSLLLLNEENGEMYKDLVLPSGGDTSYPGMFFYNDILWVSYYSSHEGKASIYLAQVRVPLNR